MDIKVAVVIPWRETKSRLPLMKYVKSWYQKNFPDAEIFFADSGHKIFNISASRNVGTEMAKDYDVIIHNDADTYPEKNAVIEGIKLACDTGFAVNPFSAAKLLSIKNTERIIYKKFNPYGIDGDLYPGSCGGVVIATPETIKKIGGWDEKFIGWGFEDVAFSIAHATLLDHGIIKVEGAYVYCLSHVIDNRKPDLVNLGKDRCTMYEQALGNKIKINKLIGKK
jgi:hypothetical protein